MKKAFGFGIAVAALVLLMYCTPVSAGMIKNQSNADLWEAACYYMRDTCNDLQPPLVVRTRGLPAGVWGQYKGGDEIFVDYTLHGMDKYTTIAHEMMHYIQHRRGRLILPGLTRNVCYAEAEVHGAIDWWMYDNDLTRYILGDSWVKPYRACWKFMKENEDG